MADGQGEAPPPDPRAAARDWITIWHSELAAMAGDREVQESWVRLVALWAQSAETILRFMPAPVAAGPVSGESAAGPARPAAAAGSAAAVVAPDARDAALQQLAERVAELERRLAERGDPIGPHAAGPGPGGAHT